MKNLGGTLLVVGMALFSIVGAAVGIAYMRENRRSYSQGEAFLYLVLIAGLMGGISWLQKRVRWGKEEPKPDLSNVQVPSKPCPECGQNIVIGATRCWTKGCSYIVGKAPSGN